MKLGIIISIAIVVLVGFFAFFLFYGVADAPTSRTGSQQLAAAELPAGLPTIYEPDAAAGGGDADAIYQQAFDFYQASARDLTDEEPDNAKIDQLIDMLIKAMNAPEPRMGWLDDQLPLAVGAEPEFGEAFYGTRDVVLGRAAELWQADQQQRAVAATKALFALGHRTFTRTQRLANRYDGLLMAAYAADYLQQFGEPYDELGEPWVNALQQIEQRWSNKMKVIYDTRPHIGDLVNVAVSDADRSFRVAATLRLGPAKFNPGSRGNKRMIQSAIDAAKESDDTLLSAAGRYADAYTLADLRRTR